MKSLHHRPLGAIFLSACSVVCSLLAAPTCAADNEPAGPGLVMSTVQRVVDIDKWTGPGFWRVGVSPFSHHFRYSAEHKYVWALAAERQTPDDWLAGASYFRNSFGQPSAYLYLGKRFTGLFGQEELFAQFSAGLLYGYRGKYEHKVPFNHNGFSPGALLSMGWQLNKKSSVTVHLLGDAAFMVQLAWDLH